MSKCKFSHPSRNKDKILCEIFNPEAYTCNNEDEACHYCGRYKDNELR